MEESKNLWLFFEGEIKKKIEVSTLSQLLVFLLEIIVGFGMGIFVAYVFFQYVFNIYFLSYWKIDNIFYVNSNFVHSLIYNIFIIMILIITIIPLMDKIILRKKIKLFLMFFIVFLIIGKDIRFSVDYLLIHFIISLVAYCCCVFIGKKIREKSLSNSNIFMKVIYNIKTNVSKFLSILVSIFISVAAIALITAWLQREFKVVREAGNIKQVILYSTQDYYIVAECSAKNNVLYVNNNVQQKISTENVEYEIIEFDKILTTNS